MKLGLIALASVFVIGSFYGATAEAKKVSYRKTQDVNFEASEVDGAIRSPDGAYLVQKRGIDFVPLYKIRKNFDDNIKESMEYVK
jgi:hypothetical protein